MGAPTRMGRFSEMKPQQIRNAGELAGLKEVVSPTRWRFVAALESMIRLVLNLQDHLNLNAGAVGQRCHAHRGPGMGSGIAVELAQEVGSAVRH